MRKYITIPSLLLLLCGASPTLRAVESFHAPYTTVCVDSDGDVTCEAKSIRDVAVSYGEPALLDIAYATLCDATTCSTGSSLRFTLTKTLPRDISPLAFLHTVRTLSSLPAAQSGTTNSPYAAYRAYAVGAARRDYAVNITVREGATEIASFVVDAKTPLHLFPDDSQPILARLLDEQSAPLKDDTPAGAILFVPVKQDGSLEPVYEGLLVPQAVAAEIIDARQLNQLRDADLAEIALNPNAEPRYLVRYQRAFKNALAEMASSLMLVRQVRDHAFSTVQLLLDRAVIDLPVVEAVGWIKSVTVPPFEAMSRNGRLRVVVENVGAVRAGYLVSVDDCSSFVGVPIVSRFVELAAGTEDSFEIELPLSGDTAAPQVCHVTLQSQTGRVFDYVDVFFDPTLSSAAERILF